MPSHFHSATVAAQADDRRSRGGRGQHEGSEQRQQIGAWGRARAGRPQEQRRIGRALAVPVLLDFIDRHRKRLREGHFRKPRRYADPQRAGGELDQRVAACRAQPVERLASKAGALARVAMLSAADVGQELGAAPRPAGQAVGDSRSPRPRPDLDKNCASAAAGAR